MLFWIIRISDIDDTDGIGPLCIIRFSKKGEFVMKRDQIEVGVIVDYSSGPYNKNPIIYQFESLHGISLFQFNLLKAKWVAEGEVWIQENPNSTLYIELGRGCAYFVPLHDKNYEKAVEGLRKVLYSCPFSIDESLWKYFLRIDEIMRYLPETFGTLFAKVGNPDNHSLTGLVEIGTGLVKAVKVHKDGGVLSFSEYSVWMDLLVDATSAGNE